jgi:hypothetical protein
VALGLTSVVARALVVRGRRSAESARV